MKRPIRVLHVIDGLPGGGTEKLLWDLVRLSPPSVIHRVVTIHPYRSDFVFAKRFESLGAYEIPRQDSIAAPEPSRPASRRDKLIATGIELVRSARRISAPLLRSLPAALRSPVWRMERVLPMMAARRRILAEARRSNADLIHSHSILGFRFGFGLHGEIAKPLVHTITGCFAQLREMGYQTLIDEYRRHRRSVARWFIAEAYTPDLHGIGVSSDRIGALRGVIDLREIDGVRKERERFRREIRRSLGIAEDSLLALSVGRYDPLKGHEHAIDALPAVLRRLPNFHWMMLGHGLGESSYHERARARGVAEHAHVIGYRDDPLPYYAAADVYLRTTTVEADNLSSFNAMAMGIPVVGFDSGCATDLLPSVGHGVLVRNADPTALAAGIHEVLSLADRGRAMGERGIEHAVRHLDIGASIDEFVGSYERLA